LLAAILETVTSQKWPWMQFSSLPINSSLQNNPRYKFSLKSENIAILKMAAVAMETVNVCQNLWPHLYRKLLKGFPQDLAYILSRIGRIFWPQKIAPFSKWRPLESNFHHYQSIPHFKITLDINFHWNRRTQVLPIFSTAIRSRFSAVRIFYQFYLSFLVIIIIIFIIIILLLLRMNLSDQIIRDWWSDLY
jgi:hypothetical protein